MLTKGQQAALDAVRQGKNVFVTGSLAAIILVYAQTLDSTSHIVNDTLCVPARYATATRSFLDMITR